MSIRGRNQPALPETISELKSRIDAMERAMGNAPPFVPQPVAVFSQPGIIEVDSSGYRVPRSYGALWDVVATLAVAGAVTARVLKASPFTGIDPEVIAVIEFSGAERAATTAIFGVCVAADFSLLGVDVIAADGVAEDLVIEVRMALASRNVALGMF